MELAACKALAITARASNLTRLTTFVRYAASAKW